MNTKRLCNECGAVIPENAPQGLCPRCLATMGLNALASAKPLTADIQMERPGAVIGPYKLLEKIGEGGFGVVFMADQVAPVHRKVALKIIKAGMDTREVIARFEAERQAIVLMDHPNIARALDAGATEAGRPYFVMELVRGIPITEHCDQNALSTRERLELFVKVCQAVQHAHQKGVIHRDLKPRNVLVAKNDGDAVPKVIDFGVAKALGQKLTEKTLFTAFHHLIGTPAYMSPEQAALSGIDVDTRADIYSLGVLLYELLTGVTPFDAGTLRKAGLDEIRRMICETEPPKPSTRLQTLGQKLPEVAQRRQAEPVALSRSVRGDLDWIVMKCLEKDRNRRYETANGLAADLRRYLDHEPVVARPPSTCYRFQKLVLRHKLVFAAGSAVAASLLIGLGVSIWFLQLALSAQHEQARLRLEANSARENAETEALRSQQVAHYLKSMLDDIAPSLAKGCTKKWALEVLTRVDGRVGQELHDQPDLEAVVRIALADVQIDIGQYGGAQTNLDRVLAIRRALFGPLHPDVARVLDKESELLRTQKRWPEAEALSRAAMGQWEQLVRGNPKSEEFWSELGHSQWRLSALLAESGRREAALPMIREALSTFEKATPIFPENPFFRQEQAFSRRLLGDLLEGLNQFDETVRQYRVAIDLYAALTTDFPNHAFYFEEEGYTTWMLAGKLQRAERFDEAAAEYRRAVSLHDRVLQSFPDSGELQSRRAAIRDDLLALLAAHGTDNEAEAVLREPFPDGGEPVMALMGKPVPGQFHLPLLDGGELELPRAQVSDVLLLDFCATWCGPCREAFPVLEDIAKEFASRGVRYVMVDQGEPPEALRRYLATNNLNTCVALDTVSGADPRGWCLMARAFGVDAIPTMVIVDRSNIVRYAHVGTTRLYEREMRLALEEILQGGSSGSAPK